MQNYFKIEEQVTELNNLIDSKSNDLETIQFLLEELENYLILDPFYFNHVTPFGNGLSVAYVITKAKDYLLTQ